LLSFIQGLSSELTVANQALLLIPLGEDGTFPLIQTAIVDALILSSFGQRDSAIELAKRRKIPLVTIGSPKLPGVPFIGVNDRQGAELAAQHLVSLGHRRFGVISRRAKGSPDGPGRAYMQPRVDAFIGLLTSAGVDPVCITVIEADRNDRASGVEATHRLLAREPERPTALFAVTDVLALAALEAATSLGLQVPTDLSVVGFDNTADAERSTPALTTIAYELFEQGRAAAAAAVAVARGEQAETPSIPPRLVVRHSTAPPRAPG
jgi:DNA-binding LacI/PurR family transcriptional regulator